MKLGDLITHLQKYPIDTDVMIEDGEVYAMEISQIYLDQACFPFVIKIAAHDYKVD